MALHLKRIGLIVLGVICFVPRAYSAETIKSFQIDISVSANAEMLVTERIEYDFDTLQKHGIFRKIPEDFVNEDGDRAWLKLDLLSVKDDKGADYTVAESGEGSYQVWKVGDADKTISGVHIYEFKYLVRNGLRFHKDAVELYWNATGNEWEVPIEQTKVKVTTPSPILAVSCYHGLVGVNNQNCKTQRESTTVEFSLPWLNVREGMTVSIGMEPGPIEKPPAFLKFLKKVGDNLALILFVPTLFGFGFIIWRYGADPLVSRSIMPRFSPPEFRSGIALSPSEVGTLVDEVAHMKDITASIVDLAIRGFIKIEELPKDSFFGAGDWKLTKISDGEDEVVDAGNAGKAPPHSPGLPEVPLIKLQRKTKKLKQFEQTLLKNLFEDANPIYLSLLKEKFYVHIPELKTSLYEALVNGGLFEKNPEKVRLAAGLLSFLFVLLMAVGILFLSIFLGSDGKAAQTWLVMTFWLPFLLAKLMPRRTILGVSTYQDVLGLKEFITRAKGDQLKFLEKHGKELFEPLLPYAMVLGVSSQWASRFEGLEYSPDWYVGTGPLNTWYISQHLNSFTASSAGTLSSSPSNSGSSGMGGGGFSGGGGGGGGGGSW